MDPEADGRQNPWQKFWRSNVGACKLTPADKLEFQPQPENQGPMTHLDFRLFKFLYWRHFSHFQYTYIFTATFFSCIFTATILLMYFYSYLLLRKKTEMSPSLSLCLRPTISSYLLLKTHCMYDVIQRPHSSGNYFEWKTNIVKNPRFNKSWQHFKN